MKKLIYQKILIASICLFLAMPFFVKAESYDAYVDAGYSGDEDGSKLKPFDNIMEAIQSGAEKIFIGKGRYKEKIEMGKSAKLYGKSKGDVVIEGSIIMGDKTLLKNITLIGSVSIKKDSESAIDSCNIKDFSLIGIDIAAGDGKLSILSSKIYNGKGKGIYIQSGNEVKINSNEIYGNSEEGIDIRAKVSGIISKNSIHDNGESGMEIIAGSSEVSIISNTIKKNHASGIATQFYSENKKNGDILIEKNILSNNRKYGIDCAIPSGGNPPAGYWKNSLNLNGNTIEGNSRRSISKFCDILEIVEEEEEIKDNKISETPIASEQEDLINMEIDREEELLKSAESIQLEIESMRNEIKSSEEKINKRNSFVKFISGPNLKEADVFRKNESVMINKKAELESLLEQSKNEELKQTIALMISEISEEIEKIKSLNTKNESGFSFLGWLFKIFYSKGIF